MNVNEPPHTGLRLLRRAEMLRRTGLGRTTQWNLERAGFFPARVVIGQRIVGWLESDVDAWLRERAGSSLTAARRDARGSAKA
jgi:prophage regulatory protein